MPREVYADTDDYTIEVDEDLDTIVHTWKQFTAGERFRAGCHDLLDLIRQEDKSKLLVDVSNVRAHRDEDKQWLQEEWIPMTIDAGIEYSVTVTTDSAISKMEIERFVDQAQDLPFTYVMATDMAEARQWLADQDA